MAIAFKMSAISGQMSSGRLRLTSLSSGLPDYVHVWYVSKADGFCAWSQKLDIQLHSTLRYCLVNDRRTLRYHFPASIWIPFVSVCLSPTAVEEAAVSEWRDTLTSQPRFGYCNRCRMEGGSEIAGWPFLASLLYSFICHLVILTEEKGSRP